MAGKSFDLAGKRIYVAGHGGMVGSAIVRRLTGAPCELIIADRDKVDLERQAQAEDFLAATKPDVVIVAAARVGGIHANNAYPAEFISENLAIVRNSIDASYKVGVQKLLFLGSLLRFFHLASFPCTLGFTVSARIQNHHVLGNYFGGLALFPIGRFPASSLQSAFYVNLSSFTKKHD